MLNRIEMTAMRAMLNKMKMKNLSVEIENNYAVHPAFKFDEESWILPLQSLLQFNQKYIAAKAIGPLAKTRGWTNLCKDLIENLRGILSSLRAQSFSRAERLFIDELESECIRVLGEELKWYRKQQFSKFIDPTSEKVRNDFIGLQGEGYFFGELSPKGLAELARLAEVELGNLRTNAATGRLKREDLSITSGSIQNAIRKELNREFQAIGVFEVLGAYTGCKVAVTGVALELSVPHSGWWENSIGGLERPPRTLYAHFDESIELPKAIVYLSDVNEKNGPTSCYPAVYDALRLNPLQELIGRVVGNIGNSENSPLKELYSKKYHQSMSSELFRRHFMRLPISLRFNSHFGWDIMPGGNLEEDLLKFERKMIGPAGSFVAFDGAKLLHRGGLIEEGERVALQVIFGDGSMIERVKGITKRIFK